MKKVIPLILLIVVFGTEAQLVNSHDATGSPIRVRSYDKVEGSPLFYH